MSVSLVMSMVLQNPSVPTVLVYSRTDGFRHDSIEAGALALEELAAIEGWTLVHTEQEDTLRSSLHAADVLVFLNTTQDVLDEASQDVFESWLRNGGGFVGIHAAADTEYEWPFYGTLLGGARFKSHPRVQEARVVIEDHGHPTTAFVESPWVCTDEWYDFVRSPRGDVHVIASLDEGSYEGGTMGEDHPIVWSTPVDSGAAIYTGLGHTSARWGEPAFRSHIAESINWAAGDGWIDLGDLAASWSPSPGWNDAGAVAATDGSLAARPGEGVLTNAATGRSGDLVSQSHFGDCELHLEFMVPEGGNSGVYLQGRYEIQILDSHGSPLPGPGDCGGVYERWDDSRSPKGFEGTPPRVNAATPAGAWQSYDIVFRAPRFDARGEKIANARLERVIHNGVLIHEAVDLSGPTRGGGAIESASGPLRLQGDHGPIAYRNLRVRRIGPATPGRGPTTQ